MSPRKGTPDQLRERARAIWANEGQPMMQTDIRDVEPKYLYRIAISLGFRKARQGSFRGRYVTGPCLECLVPHARDAIDRDHLCPSCRSGKDGFFRMLPLGEESAKRRPRVTIDYAWEREQSRRRMEERWAGERPNLGQPRTPVSRILRNERLA